MDCEARPSALFVQLLRTSAENRNRESSFELQSLVYSSQVGLPFDLLRSTSNDIACFKAFVNWGAGMTQW